MRQRGIARRWPTVNSKLPRSQAVGRPPTKIRLNNSVAERRFIIGIPSNSDAADIGDKSITSENEESALIEFLAHRYNISSDNDVRKGLIIRAK